jgi:hypothetical protein
MNGQVHPAKWKGLMRTRSRAVRALTAIALVALLATLVGSQGALAGQKSKSKASLLGSWSVTITGGPGTPELPDWYGSQITFSPGGGAVATITDPNIQTGHGAWERLGKRKFVVTILLFQFDLSGDFLGTLKANATLKVNKKSTAFESDDYRFKVFDPDGNPTGLSGVGAAHGVRINVER